MIAKRTDKRADVHDNYTHLAEYIAAAAEEGEKLDKFWIVNSPAGTELADLEDALLDIEAVRAMKPRIKNKTYHLVISFRPGEREKLSPDDLRDIERHFAEALGFAEHQRVVGTHVNTDNFHMHVAYNKIHPETFKCHTPGRDFFSLESVCRAMERKYGLYVDNGLSDTLERDKGSQKARQFESQTWQQSFEGHLREHKSEILAAIGGARTWHELHEGLAGFDAGLKKRGAGLVFFHLGETQTHDESQQPRSLLFPRRPGTAIRAIRAGQGSGQGVGTRPLQAEAAVLRQAVVPSSRTGAAVADVSVGGNASPGSWRATSISATGKATC